MKKDIYKEVPEIFHRQFCKTLENLEDVPAKSTHFGRRYGLLLAAAVLACASVTAAAAGIMGWHERASDFFGTEKELEDKLSMKHVAIPQNGETEGDGLKFRALQAVRTDSYVYFLVEMTVPEGIEWNGDILFEECEAVGNDCRCVPGFVSDSFADGKVLLELQVLYDGSADAARLGEEIRVRFKNLVQTERLEIVETLAEGEWELSLHLPPAEADMVRFYPEGAVGFGEHELYFTKVDVSPFRIRLYADQETAVHAAWGRPVSMAGVRYEDGTTVEEAGMLFGMAGHTDEAGEFCFEMTLENAVDPSKVTGVMLRGTEQQELNLRQGRGNQERQDREDRTERVDTGSADMELPDTVPLSSVSLLYVKYGHVLLEAEKAIWWWDARCGSCRQLVSLEKYGFDREQGGEITLSQGRQIQILPRRDSEEMCLYNIADQELLTLDRETFWPWPSCESYRESLREVKELIPDADGRYAPQAFFAQEGQWYCLYSEDGSVSNMELRITGDK